MLLTRLIRQLHRDDRGVAMAAVMGLMAVSLLTSTLVVSSVIVSTSFTTATRAGVESQAAAEAGVAAARAGLITQTCAANANQYVSAPGTVPEYVATVWVPSGSGWTPGCPSGTATQVRIVSTGYAEHGGVSGASGRDETSIEVVLSSASVPTQIEASGPAIYAYYSAGFGGGGKLVSVDGSSPDILIQEGDVNCTGGASGQADIVVNNGNLTISNGCVISGNAWASGKVTLPGGPNVGGNVVANQLEITGGSKVGGSVWITTSVALSGNVEIVGNVTAGSMSFSNGGTVGGNTQVAGAVTFSGGGPNIKGNLTAGSFFANSSGDVRGDAWVYGSTTIAWTTVFHKSLTTKSLTGPGGGSPPDASWWKWDRRSFFPNQDPTIVPAGPGASPYATNPAPPATPLVPNWVDFDYDMADWTGFANVTLSSSGTCTYTQLLAAVNSFAGQPGVINALGCVGGVFIGSDHKLPIPADVAIFAHKFNLTEGGGFTATATKRLWLITPDETADALPTCTSGDDSFGISGGFTFSSNLHVMMYTPCKVMLGSSTNVRGQVFAGKAGIDGGAQLGYVAVGLPGVDLSTGASGASASTEADRTIVSFRNVEVGG